MEEKQSIFGRFSDRLKEKTSGISLEAMALIVRALAVVCLIIAVAAVVHIFKVMSA